MSRLSRLYSDGAGSAAAEMALVTPLLLLLLVGSMELGNYFYHEHTLVKSVRDGARYAARQAFSNFEACDAAPGGSVVDETKQVTRTGRLSGGVDRLPNWTSDDAQFAVLTRCSASSDGVTYSGIYSGYATGGARYVEVTAVLPYQPLMGLLGIDASDFSLQATQQAAVAGI